MYYQVNVCAFDDVFLILWKRIGKIYLHLIKANSLTQQNSNFLEFEIGAGPFNFVTVLPVNSCFEIFRIKYPILF